MVKVYEHIDMNVEIPEQPLLQLGFQKKDNGYYQKDDELVIVFSSDYKSYKVNYDGKKIDFEYWYEKLTPILNAILNRKMEE